MSDFADGWLIWGVRRSAIVDALAAERQPAFLTRQPRPVVVFARDGREAASRISARLGPALLVTFSAGDDWGELSLLNAGRILHAVKTAGSIATSSQWKDVAQLLSAAGRRLRLKPATPLLRSRVPSAVVEALGLSYDRLSHRSYETLLADRIQVNPQSVPDLTYVSRSGEEEGYPVAYRPVSPARNATTLAFDSAAPIAALLHAMRRLDPSKATAEARASLEELARLGPRRTAPEARTTAVREAAASLLSRCVEALPKDEQRREAARLGRSLTQETDAATRAVLALVLRRVGHLAGKLLEKALTAEIDPTAARREFEALRGISHELPDAELLTYAESKSVVNRKGAYALLEQSASPHTFRELERRLSAETDASATVLLTVVIGALREELSG